MTNKKRFLISTLRTFLAGFIGTFILFLGAVHSLEDLNSQLLIATVFSATISGVNLVLKTIHEKLQGQI